MRRFEGLLSGRAVGAGGIPRWVGTAAAAGFFLALGAGPLLLAAAPAQAAGGPMEQAFLQISKTTGAVTAAVALPGGNVEGEDYDGVVCQGAGAGKCFLAADHHGFLLMGFSSFACNPTTSQTPIGAVGDFTIDAMALDTATDTLFVSVGDQLEVVDRTSGTLTPTKDWFGHIDGAAGPVEADALAALGFDLAGNTLYGVVAAGDNTSLLVQIDPATGAVVHNAFGTGMDYVTVARDGGRGEVRGIAVVDSVMYATISRGDTDPHLATVNMVTGATSDIGSQGVPSVGYLTADAMGNLYGVSGTQGDQISSLPCPTPPPPVLTTQAEPVVAPPAEPVVVAPEQVLGVQHAKTSPPALPFTGLDLVPLVFSALACLVFGGAALLVGRGSRSRATPPEEAE
ncbi:MAG TPA: hypothetical protein VFW71_08285 [Actinomycetota bacterium]|nr:hypothetical protein [Actinomycetota bacterium]